MLAHSRGSGKKKKKPKGVNADAPDSHSDADAHTGDDVLVAIPRPSSHDADESVPSMPPSARKSTPSTPTSLTGHKRRRSSPHSPRDAAATPSLDGPSPLDASIVTSVFSKPSADATSQPRRKRRRRRKKVDGTRTQRVRIGAPGDDVSSPSSRLQPRQRQFPEINLLVVHHEDPVKALLRDGGGVGKTNKETKRRRRQEQRARERILRNVLETKIVGSTRRRTNEHKTWLNTHFGFDDNDDSFSFSRRPRLGLRRVPVRDWVAEKGRHREVGPALETFGIRREAPREKKRMSKKKKGRSRSSSRRNKLRVMFGDDDDEEEDDDDDSDSEEESDVVVLCPLVQV